jgi:hypothetical protein
MSDQPTDLLSDLSRWQQQARIQSQIDKLFPREEDHAAATVQAVEDSAYYAAQESAAAYDDIEGSLTDVSTQARDFRQRIESGLLSDADARRDLAKLWKHQTELVARTASTKTVYERAKRVIADPAAERDALIDKYPALRR